MLYGIQGPRYCGAAYLWREGGTMYAVNILTGEGWRAFGFYTAECEADACAMARASLERHWPNWVALVSDYQAIPWVTVP